MKSPEWVKREAIAFHRSAKSELETKIATTEDTGLKEMYREHFREVTAFLDKYDAPNE